MNWVKSLVVLGGFCGLLSGEEFDFQTDASNWRLSRECTYAPHGGRNGSGGLSIVRTNSKIYSVSSYELKLTRGKRYSFGGWIKTENVQGRDQGASIALEFSRLLPNGKKQFLTGQYLAGVKGTRDWTKITGDKIIPRNADICVLSIYIRKNMTGTAYYDDLFVRPAVEQVRVYAPFTRLLPKQSLELRVIQGTKIVPDHTVVELTFNQHKSRHTTVAGKIQVKLPYENGYLQAVCRNQQGKKIGFSRIQLRTSKESVPVPRVGQCRIDRLGRAWVDGKKFMPIGIFTGGVSEEYLKCFQKAGLNVVMPYSTMSLRRHKNDPLGSRSLREVFDLIHQYGLKITPSLKDAYPGTRNALTRWDGIQGVDNIVKHFVQNFKTHPAVLAYYINDEMPTSRLPELIARRELINRLDPHHPVWSVQYQFDELPMYGGATDILAVDPYPINKNRVNSMQMVDNAMTQLKKTGLPAWVVPQIMSFASCHAKSVQQAKSYPSPTRQEMQAMVLLMAGYGAKGFIFYKYEDLKHWSLGRGNYAKRWPDVVATIKLLKTLEPFIMSSRSVEPAKLKVTQGKVRGFYFYNDKGQKKLVLCALGPGAAQAEIIGRGQAPSFSGKTQQVAGKLVFKGQNIDFDIIDLD